ncbi:MAG: hypothetical protein PHP45_05940 [Elusimicrobiales bacterium]|nr:hypothetical protein [Elusimicrobiales bacterium]
MKLKLWFYSVAWLILLAAVSLSLWAGQLLTAGWVYSSAAFFFYMEIREIDGPVSSLHHVWWLNGLKTAPVRWAAFWPWLPVSYFL